MKYYNHRNVNNYRLFEDFLYSFPLIKSRIGNKSSKKTPLKVMFMKGVDLMEDIDTDFGSSRDFDRFKDIFETNDTHILKTDSDNPEEYSILVNKRRCDIKETIMNTERIINCNYIPGKSSFLTLTYGYTMKNDKISSSHILKFLDYLRQWYVNYYPTKNPFHFTYMKDLQKNGNIHYHVCLFNIEYLPIEILNRYWKYGNINIEEMVMRKIDNNKDTDMILKKNPKFLDIMNRYRLTSFTPGRLTEIFLKENLSEKECIEFRNMTSKVNVSDIGFFTTRYCFKYIDLKSERIILPFNRISKSSSNHRKPITKCSYNVKLWKDYDKYVEKLKEQKRLQDELISKGEPGFINGIKILSQQSYDLKYKDPKTGKEVVNHVFRQKSVREEDCYRDNTKLNQDLFDVKKE